MAAAPDDRVLLDAWRAGDGSAGGQLFQRHFLSVTRFIESRAHPDVVDDLVQSTFERCVASRTKIRDGLRVRAYLLRIARNELLMHLRSRRVRETEVATETRESMPVSWLANYRREQRLLLRALRRLPIEQQFVIALHYWEDLTTVEIGDVLDVPVNTVKTRLHRARQRLASELGRLEAEPELLESTISRMEHWVASIRQQGRAPAES